MKAALFLPQITIGVVASGRMKPRKLAILVAKQITSYSKQMICDRDLYDFIEANNLESFINTPILRPTVTYRCDCVNTYISRTDNLPSMIHWSQQEKCNTKCFVIILLLYMFNVRIYSTKNEQTAKHALLDNQLQQIPVRLFQITK